MDSINPVPQSEKLPDPIPDRSSKVGQQAVLVSRLLIEINDKVIQFNREFANLMDLMNSA